MTERKQHEQQKDAQEFMRQHWKLNDPGMVFTIQLQIRLYRPLTKASPF